MHLKFPPISALWRFTQPFAIKPLDRYIDPSTLISDAKIDVGSGGFPGKLTSSLYKIWLPLRSSSLSSACLRSKALLNLQFEKRRGTSILANLRSNEPDIVAPSMSIP